MDRAMIARWRRRADLFLLGARKSLADWAIGPKCPLCLERRRGPRTLDRHIYVDHAGELR